MAQSDAAFSSSAVAKLRAAALAAIGLVVFVAVAQAAVLVMLGSTLPRYGPLASDSALRGGLVARVVSEVEANPGHAAVDVELARLGAIEGRLDDLGDAGQMAYRRFVDDARRLAAHPATPAQGRQLRAEADSLAALFEVRSAEYAAESERVRYELRNGVVAGSVVILAAAWALYALAVLPTVKGVNRLFASEARQRERLRIASALSFAKPGEIGEQIDRTLGLAAVSLRTENACVYRIEGTMLTVAHGAGPAYAPGERYELERSLARHVFGAREVVAVDDASVLGRDAEHDRERAGSFVATTLFVDDEPFGVVAFFSEAARKRAFDDGDKTFVQIIGAFVGSAMEREKRDAELSEKAYVDPLTRLPNRAYFIERLTEAMEHAQRRSDGLCVHFVDLDGFKGVNDDFGHAAGDEVLRVVAARMRLAVRGDDVLARLGGDEFVALQLSPGDDAGALLLGRRLVAAASEPISIAGVPVMLGASVGIARFPQDAASLEQLLGCADRAMYEAKRSGKNAAVLFDPELGPAA